MDVEWATLSKAIEVEGFTELAQASIGASFFLDPDNAGVYRWMEEHWSKFGKSPGGEAFQHHYPEYALVATPEPLSYYVEELRAQRRYALLTGALDAVREPIRKGDSIDAIKLLHTSLEAIDTEVTELLDEDITEQTAERLEYYDTLATMPGIKGLPTGFPTIDLATGGLQNEQLVTLVGLQKRYKSFLLMAINVACHRAGARTLFASFEMSNTEQKLRHDAIRASISHDRLQRGRFTPLERKRLVRMMHEIEDMPPMTLIHDPAGTTTVSGLAAKIAQYKPDVAFVDGTYLMEPEIPGVEPNSPQALTSITRSLKRLAQRVQIPIVQTTQALSWKSKRGLTLDSIGYSSSFAQDSDVILGTEEIRENGEVNDREFMLRIIAARNCPRKDVRVLLDWEHSAFTELEEVSYGTDDTEDDM